MPSRFVVVRPLDEEDQKEANDEGKQGHTLNKTGRDNHQASNVSGGFGLASRPIHRGAGQSANSDRGANGRNAGSETGGEVCKSSGVHSVLLRV